MNDHLLNDSTPRPGLVHGTTLDARPAGFGAVVLEDVVRVRTFTPSPAIRLHLLTGAATGEYAPESINRSIAEFLVPRAAAGDRYQFTLGDSALRPDPASRYQPEGVHGPSEIVDPRSYPWRHRLNRPPRLAELVVYELHAGTFTPEGTFLAAAARLPELRALGVTAIELMPVGDFAGSRNWGYDGVCLFAPARAYGRPDDLRALVDAAHALDLAVLLDVVYNHLGPEGAYLPLFHPGYVTARHPTPWGGAVNLDGPGSDLVRAFIVDNARHWITEYRMDGLRLDATHALIDSSRPHIVTELADTVRREADRPIVVHGEDHRNLASLIEPGEQCGWGLDGVWADDFHHIVRRLLAGDAHGYYEDYQGTTGELARTIRQGWLYTGQYSTHGQCCRGTDAAQVPMFRFVVCLQNHDQVGNRGPGDRLHHRIDASAWRAASTILLTAPMTPLLFMGQEWASSSPFQYFTDLEPGLGRMVTEGRRREFQHFPDFVAPNALSQIPDPQAESTFTASKLDWHERTIGAHAATLALYTDLLRLRRDHPALGGDTTNAGDAEAVDAGALVVRRQGSGERFLVVARLVGRGPVRTPALGVDDGRVDLVLTTEDARYAADPVSAQVSSGPDEIAVDFQRPGAVILRVG